MAIKPKISGIAEWALIAAGLICLSFAGFGFPVGAIDLTFVIFVLFTIFFGSALQIQFPRSTLRLTISDTLIFAAMLKYGGQTAILLAAVESISASFILKFRGISISRRTIFLNAAIALITTSATFYLLNYTFGQIQEIAVGGSFSDITKIVCAMGVTQFLTNSLLVSLILSLKQNKTIREIWSENCLNTLIVYLAGALSAGVLFKAIQNFDRFLIIFAFGLLGIVYLTSRRYVSDVREAAAEAEQSERERIEQAENHIVELRQYIGEQEKISQALSQSRESFRHAAFHDSLTDLPNRSLFIEKLKFLLKRSEDVPNTKFAVMFLDLNRFKTINDSLGHTAGDRLILNVAQRLAMLVGKGDSVARFSGDEFGIILNSINGIDDAVNFAEMIRQCLLSSFSIGGRQIFTSVSIGIALNHPKYSEAEEILRDADIAMYYAKECDKDFVVFDQAMHTRAVNLLQLETDLRYAAERDELLVYYQPIINLATMKLTGFEALMRWNHPQRGIIPPVEFIPVAEETNYIVPLTLWILRKSCEQLVEWQNRSPLNANLLMSVNLSGKHFAQADIVEQIQKIIVGTGVNPACLKLELTESAIMENAERTIMLLKNLRALGVRLSIDDFGTGYSSLSYLHRFPIDMLKVDRSFVSSMEEGTENGEIVRTVIALARNLKLNVVAEGIESIHQLHQLRILGCEYAQGYLFSRPVSAEEAQAILDDKTRWQNIIPNNNPAIVAQNREFTHLRLMNNQNLTA